MIYEFNAGEIFQIAIETEENGKQFYQRCIEYTENPDVKDIFSYLAREEERHKNRFMELKERLPGDAVRETIWDPEQDINRYLKMMADMSIFRSDLDVERALSEMKGAEDALKLGIQFEKDSIIFYLTMQDVTRDKEGKDYISQVIDEEKGHLKTLLLERQKITDGKPV